MRSMYLRILVLLFIFSFFGCSEDSEIEYSIINSTNVLSENSNKWIAPTRNNFVVIYENGISPDQILAIRRSFFADCKNPIFQCEGLLSLELSNELPTRPYEEFWKLTDCIESGKSIDFTSSCPNGLLRDIQDELGVANVIY